MLAAARDVAIIILAAESIVAILIVILIAWKAYQIVRLAKNKAEEFSVVGRVILEHAREASARASETAATVRGSAEFVSDVVVSPIVQVVSAVAGARGFVSSLLGLSGSQRDGGGR